MRSPIPPQMLFAMRWAAYLKVVASRVNDDDDEGGGTEPTDPNDRILTEDGAFLTDEDGNRLIL
jgi:hypothetical protein